MICVIGVGNPFRGDDGAGIEVVRRLRATADVEILEHDGEPVGLLDAWRDAEVAYVIDAVRADAEPGTIYRIEVGPDGRLPPEPRRDSSHALGLGDAVELARVLDRLPARLVLIGIAGRAFGVGDASTPAVDRAIAEVATSLEDELRGIYVHE